MSKTLTTFVKEHRNKLHKYIDKTYNDTPKTDMELHLWVLRDNHLYDWARSEGVDLETNENN